MTLIMIAMVGGGLRHLTPEMAAEQPISVTPHLTDREKP
jgi:hypothetical protein